MKDVYVFLGPTLAAEKARTYLPAVYRPPLGRGDVAQLLGQLPRAIVVIDVRVGPGPRVLHGELLAALGAGLPVYGAAGGGALLAAELSPFGMVGTGAIYRQLRRGTWKRDDDLEVAPGKSPAGPAHSVPLVDLRDAVEAAVARKLLRARVGAQVVQSLARMPHQRRTWRCLVARARVAGEGPARLRALGAFLRNVHIPLTHRDAVGLLRRLAVDLRASGLRAPRPFAVERPATLASLLASQALRQAARTKAVPVSADQQLRTGHSLGMLRKKVLMRLLARAEAARLQLVLGPDQVQEAADAFRRSYGLSSARATAAWLEREGLSAERLGEAVHDFVLIERLESLYDEEIRALLPDQVRVSTARLREGAA